MLQIMECEDESLFERWMANWSDIVDSEIVPVMTGAEEAARFSPRDHY